MKNSNGEIYSSERIDESAKFVPLPSGMEESIVLFGLETVHFGSLVLGNGSLHELRRQEETPRVHTTILIA